MGLGVTGVSNALEICGHRYASESYLEVQDKLLDVLRRAAYSTSIEMARTKGSFPLFDPEAWLDSGYAKTLPEDLRDGIRRHGLRNGLLLSIAPTGTISLAADNVSSSIEPPYELEAERLINFADGPRRVAVSDYALEEYGVRCRTAMETSPTEHVQVLCRAQRYIDSAISKTVNVKGAVQGKPEPGEITFTEFRDVYRLAYDGQAKGCSTFNANGKRAGILTASGRDTSPAGRCYVTAEGQKVCE
jgi:ribonucleoside-diphosphate reductase alpha chain